MTIIGIGFVIISNFFSEISASLAKYESQRKHESIYTIGFLHFFWGAIFLLFIGIFLRDSFVFQLAALPTFLIRAVLDSFVMYFGTRGMRDGERSTFGFLKTLTIPLLVSIDMFLGYAISPRQIIGIILIAVALLLLFINHGIKKKGARDIAISAILAAFTISLYKYNITHYNTVEAEQGLMLLYLMTFSYFMARKYRKENPFKFLLKPRFFFQSLAAGVGTIGLSFAYVFAPASIIATAQRSLAVLFSIVSGEVYFHEKNILVKLTGFVLVLFGIWLLI